MSVAGNVASDGLSFISELDILIATNKPQRRRGPTMAPSTPRQKIPPAIDRPVRYGCPPLQTKITLVISCFKMRYLMIVNC